MMILVTGGASSGKSAFAETLACAPSGPRFYLAAMKPFGEEGARRIARHRALRAGKGFRTVECYEGLFGVEKYTASDADDLAAGQEGKDQSKPMSDCGQATVLSDEKLSASRSDRSALTGIQETALLESLGNVVANELFGDDGSVASADQALRAVVEGVEYVGSLFDNLVIVGDEVGGDGWRYDETTETYIRIIGSAACALAARCDVVVECVAGQPYVVKGAAALKAFLHKEVTCA